MDNEFDNKNILTEEPPKRAAYIEVIPSNLDSEVINRIAIALIGRGCSHALKKHSGCTYCPFTDRSKQGKEVPPKFLLEQFVSALKTVDLDKRNIKEIDLYISGSFLSDQEMPKEARLLIMGEIAKKSKIKKVLIESRPEYIRTDNITEIKNILDNKKLQIGIGLETVDDNLREKILNKGFGRKDYESALKILTENEVELLTYVLLKPTVMMEKEAVAEATKTIKYIQEKNMEYDVDGEVSLNPAFVADNTSLKKSFDNGEYSPPRLWSVVDVLQESYKLGKIRVGISAEGLSGGEGVTHNCGKCDKKVREAILKYNQTRDISVFDGLDCECRKK